MAPFELLLLSALATFAVAMPVEPYLGYTGKPAVPAGLSANWYQSDLNQGSGAPFGGYQCLQGVLTKYPPASKWLSFNALWELNAPAILAANGGSANLQSTIRSSIVQVAAESHVDARFILATLMQESTGKAAVVCTGTMPNCGLLQASYGSHSFDATKPEQSILLMIREGVEGTISGGEYKAGGPGLAQYLTGELSWVQNPAPGNPYVAARLYNSGSVGTNLDDIRGWGTVSYVNDIANRLLGWDGHSAGFSACH